VGEVHEAWDLLLNRSVAIKRLHLVHVTHLARFIQEAQLQARIEHPNICRVLDADVVEGIPCIAMQLIKGGTLADLAGTLTPIEAAALMRPVALAVQAAHGVHLVHRDLKPSNILLERDRRGAWVPYVTDFGLAKDLAGEGMTLTHSPMGTPGYIAPELFEGTREASPLSDLWSLGATLRTLVAADAATPASDREATPPGEIPPRPPGLPRDFRLIIRRCMEVRPEDRYATAGDLAEDLRRFAQGEPLKGSGRVDVERWLRKARRHPSTLLLGALVLLALGGAAAGTATTTSRARARLRASQGVLAEAKDIEYLLRLERTRPSHDLRPAFQEVRRRLSRIEAELAAGRLEPGPARYALGRGYLELRDFDRALENLRAAWALNFRLPEVGTALGKAHLGAFIDRRPEARGQGQEALKRLEQEHLTAAQHCFLDSGTDAFEPPQVGQALLALASDQPEQALQKAREALAARPWDTEAKILEASAWMALGLRAQWQGQLQVAQRDYAEFRKLGEEARALGRSDEAVLCALIRQRMEGLWVDTAALAPAQEDQELRALKALSDDLLDLDPQNPESLAIRLTLLFHEASRREALSRDPRAPVQEGLALVRRAGEVADARNQVGRALVLLLTIQARWESGHGQDPHPTIASALQHSPSPGEERLELLHLQATWELEHGQDPSPALDQALAITGIAVRNGPLAYHYYYRGESLRWKGYWALEQGQDPGPWFQRAVDCQKRALALNPQEKWARIELARTRGAWGRYVADHGSDPSASFAQGLREADQAVRQGPRQSMPLRVLAELHWSMGRWQLAAGRDPGASLQAGQAAIRKAIQLDGERWPLYLIQVRLLLVEADWARRTGRSPRRALDLARGAQSKGRSLDPGNLRWAALAKEFRSLGEG
jgi:serine/threonine-protein kinase